MKPLFLLMFSAIPFLSSAQGKIRYSYDRSGNRIERVVQIYEIFYFKVVIRKKAEQ